jgi:O-antigen ligase
MFAMALVAVCAAVIGVGVAAVGQAFGPAAMLGLPIALILLIAAINRPAVGVALVLLVIPFGLKTLPVGFVAVQGVALVAIGGGILHRLARGRLPLTWAAPLWWGLAVLVACLLATPRALDSTLAVKQDIDVTLGLLLVLTVVDAAVSMRTVRRLVHVVLVVGAGISLLSLTNASGLRAAAGGLRVDHRLQGTFTEPNQFGGFCAIVLMLSIGTALGARTRGERWLASLAGVPAGVALLLALSRGAWIGTMLAGVLMLIMVAKARRALAASVALLLVLAPLLGVLTPDIPQVRIVRERVSTLRLSERDPYDNRPAIWREALREISTSPVLGKGPGQFPVVSTQAASQASTVFADHAHNVLLTVAAEVGIPAALCLVGFTLTCLTLLVRSVRRLRADPDAILLVGIGAALTALVGQGLVDFTLRNADVFLLMSVLAGLLLAATRSTDSHELTAPTIAR